MTSTGTVMDVIHSGLRPDRHEEEWQTDVRLEDLAAEMKLPAATTNSPRSPAD